MQAGILFRRRSSLAPARRSRPSAGFKTCLATTPERPLDPLRPLLSRVHRVVGNVLRTILAFILAHLQSLMGKVWVVLS